MPHYGSCCEGVGVKMWMAVKRVSDRVMCCLL